MIIKQVLRLYTHGKKKYYIRRNLGISRNTVDKFIAGFISHKLSWGDVNSMSDKQLIKLFEYPNPPLPQRQAGLIEEFNTSI